MLQRQIAAAALRFSLATYLSQMNGKSAETNLREAVNTSLVTNLSVTEVLEHEIDRLRAIDRLAMSRYNYLYNDKKGD